MAVVDNATPLLSLDAVVLDTETTGLDPASCRVVEIAAVRLAAGRLLEDGGFRSLVRPDVPVPAAASAVHNIRDADLAGAPDFREVWPRFQTFAGEAVLIGHSVGFDLAVLGSECARRGLRFPQRRALDLRLLAERAAPGLADYGIEALASWLGVAVAARHSAHGDAVTTARLFVALVPVLRKAGIRTLGEAMLACRTLADARGAQGRAGWADLDGAAAPALPAHGPGGVDVYPYRHRVGEVMRAPACVVDTGTPTADAVARMAAERVSSVYVAPAGAGQPLRPATTGIVTERDILRALAAHGAEALAMPVERLMSAPLAAVAADAHAYRAIARMRRLAVRHLGVVDEQGTVIGAVSARDLLRLRADEAVVLGDEIEVAADVHALGVAWAKLPRVAAALRREGLSGREIAGVVSSELGALTRQAALIAEQRMRADGLGDAPCAYAVAVLGSAGRGESLLAMDQDNALVFAEGAPGGAEDIWFERLARHLCGILHEVGVPYCKGGVMAENPEWRGSLVTWRRRVEDWIGRSNPADLLSVDIFFDMRAVHGETGLAGSLWREAFDLAHDNIGFAKLLAEAAGPVEPGLGLFGRFLTEQGRINLKRTGLFGIVTFARLIAIRHHVLERATAARLAGARALGIGGAEDLEALAEAHETFLHCVLGQQLADIEAGIPPTSRVVVKRLSRRDRERLRAALTAVQSVEVLGRDLLFGR